MKSISLAILLILTVILSVDAQPTIFDNIGPGTFVDCYPSIKTYGLSKLWRSDSILLQDDNTRAPFSDPIGYIGENFQRFDIYYLSVTKRKADPYVYDVTGKTIHFREDNTQKTSGWLEGKLTTGFCLDKKGRLSYDAIMTVADGYYNNQCEPAWTSYTTRKSKKCNL